MLASPSLHHQPHHHPPHGSLAERNPIKASPTPPSIRISSRESHQLHASITPQDSILMFHQLLSDGTLMPNHLTFPSLLKACGKLSALEEGRQLHSQALKRGFHCDAYVQNGLVRMYAKCLACQDALRVFVICPEPNIISQNDLIAGFVKLGDLDSGRRVFDGMVKRNVVSWSVMIDGYARNGRLDIALELFDAMPERNQFAWNSLIFGYLKWGRVEAAQRVFDRMAPERGVVAWTTMISGYTQAHLYKEALDLFLNMQLSGVTPNMITLVSVLPAVSRLGALSQGRWIHSYVEQKGVEMDPVLGSALVDMYSKCGCIEDALALFEKLKHKELSAWNSIILGLAAHGRGKDALCFFSRMREDSSMIPNDITFVGVLTACSHAGLVDEGRDVFDLLTSYYKLTPNIRHYGCMVDLLGRAGLLEEAMDFLEEMPIEPNLVVWKILLGACRVRKNVELAEYILRKLVKLCPQDSGFYSLVYNIFNEAGRRDDAGKLRREMNDLQVHKAAGCSWVEVDGVVYEFLMGRESYHAQQSREILRMLHEMDGLMKFEEHEMDASGALAGQEEDRFGVGHHSELCYCSHLCVDSEMDSEVSN